jgi:outer membrane receptor protein involved in Fe transport
MKRIIGLTAALAISVGSQAESYNAEDSATVKDIEEIIIVSSPKENNKLRSTPTAVSLFDQNDIETRHIGSLKELSAYVPNFFMPDYGSSLTSAAYIRGVGSRINTPAVSLYVDNVAYADKTAYDIHFLDIERIDVLRGPQAILYGRNAMGGLLRVYTRNPFTYQGTDIKLGASTKDNGYHVTASHYHKLNNQLAFSASAFYTDSKGFFRNEIRHEDIGGKMAGGGRGRVIWYPNESLKMDFSTDYSRTKDKGYPYEYRGTVSLESDPYAGYQHQIFYNDPCTYQRDLLNTSLLIEHQADRYIMSSVTAYQYLNDEMVMDQDFTNRNFFTLTQKQKINSWSEELTFKNRTHHRWEWVNGAYLLYQTLRTQSPVTLTEDFMNTAVLGKANASMNGMGMNMAFDLHGKPFCADGTFQTPTADVALFHQSTFHDLFNIEGLSLIAGLRIEYEKNSLDYYYGGNLTYDMNITSPMMPIAFSDLTDESLFDGKISHDYWQWLPKIALQYEIDSRNNVYASISKGSRSGGYNVQMFSDLVQGALQSAMTGHIKNEMTNLFNRPPFTMMPEAIKQMIINQIPVTTFEGNPSQTRYKPEYSYNYEIGGHFSLFNNKIQLDMAAFYMDIYDQQISKFAGSGLGRIMVNAGRGQSAGAELSLRGSLIDKKLDWFATYGYTHATFKRYEAQTATEEQTGINYNGNFVPFVPQHTMSAGFEYTQPLKNKIVKAVFVGLNTTGIGPLYWTEDNLYKQKFYAVLNAHAGVDFGTVKVDFWGRNMTNSQYDTFFFTSNATTDELKFGQCGNPIQFGIDVSMHF